MLAHEEIALPTRLASALQFRELGSDFIEEMDLSIGPFRWLLLLTVSPLGIPSW